MESQNLHLNVFSFFNESPENQFIENNLSRALTLCLQNSNVFLSRFLQSIVNEEDFSYLTGGVSKEKLSVDIQVNMNSVDVESYKKVYAIAITADQNLDMSDFMQQKELDERERHITDVWAEIKDIAFVIEVKRNKEDCKQQLYNQVLSFIKAARKIPVSPLSLPWQKVVELMQETVNVNNMLGAQNVFIRDFLSFSESRYPEWFNPRPFSVIKFSSRENSIEMTQLNKRLAQVLSCMKGYVVLDYKRLGIALPFSWASEFIPHFATSNSKNYLFLTIWPGNTKSQGAPIYKKSLDWVNKKSLMINGKNYEISIGYDIKFSHFNRYIANIFFRPNEKGVKKIPHTAENYIQKSGRWEVDRWDEFEDFMDQHFDSDFRWRTLMNWDQLFKLTERTYFTLSLGFEVSLLIPFDEIRNMDQGAGGELKVAYFLEEAVKSFSRLTD